MEVDVPVEEGGYLIHHQAQGGGDMMMAVMPLKYLVFMMIDLLLLRAVQRSVVGEVKVGIEMTVVVEPPPIAGEVEVAMLVKGEP